MRLGVLFSGGKDSCYALLKKIEEVVCLITVVSENPESYMFHTPNINLAGKQAEAIGLPILIQKTKGEKEKELGDLEEAIEKSKEKYKIEGLVTGALKSAYQSSRIKKICDKLGLECINPLWQKDQIELLEELVKNNFEVIITGVFALGLDQFLGRKIDGKFIDEIKELSEKYKINPAGEGGEFESFVLDAPFFKKRIDILDFETKTEENSGILTIKKVRLVNKK